MVPNLFHAIYSNLMFFFFNAYKLVHISRFHDRLIFFQFDTIAPNLVPPVSNYLVQLSEWEQMKKGTKIRNRFV